MTDRNSAVLHRGELDTLELVLSGLLGDSEYALPAAAPGDDWRPTLALRTPPPHVGASMLLHDPDGTPLARIEITAALADPDGRSWVAGPVSPLRTLEHGPSRRRLSSDSLLSDRAVALLGGRVGPADILLAERWADGRALDLVYAGPSASAATARSLHELDACAALIAGSRVHYLPDASDDARLAPLVLRKLGAADLIDLRTGELAPDRGGVIVFTGLSGSGKSTVARRLVEHLRTRTPHAPVLLDGDDVRRQLSAELGFSAEDRDRNLQRVAWVAARVAEAGGIAVCAPIAPFESSRLRMREKVEPDSAFLLVHVATPLEVAEARDRKGLYAKARGGLVKDFTGIDSPYEVPPSPDAVIDTSTMTIEDCVDSIIAVMRTRGLLP